MSASQRFTLEDGGYVLLELEVARSAVGEFDEKSVFPRVNHMVSRVTANFDEAIENAQASATALIQKFKTSSARPDEVEVTFGLKATGDIGSLLIAKGSAEANYTVTLKWKREDVKNRKT